MMFFWCDVGAPYLEKMKWDYTEMINRLQMERRVGANEGV